jgi:hypothetical protein
VFKREAYFKAILNAFQVPPVEGPAYRPAGFGRLFILPLQPNKNKYERTTFV